MSDKYQHEEVIIRQVQREDIEAVAEMIKPGTAYFKWEGRAILEDLYVRRDQRRRGIGERLFDAVAKEAAAAGTRLDFHVRAWNSARSFYEARGATKLTEKEETCAYRLTGDALTRLVDNMK